MMEFGDTLRKAREARGISAEELARSTHMMARQVEALEREDFSWLAAPIYGRGFVKLYCESVGLDPKPMTEAFMELYRSNHPPKSVPPPVPAPAPAPEPAPVPAEPPPAPAEEPPAVPGPADDGASAPFSLESEVVKDETSVPPPSNPFTVRNDGPAAPARPARIAPPQPIDMRRPFKMPSLPHIPRRVWRLVAVAACAVAILYLLLAGFRALYRAATNGATDPEIPPRQESVPAGKPSAATAPRDTRTLAPLYIDD